MGPSVAHGPLISRCRRPFAIAGAAGQNDRVRIDVHDADRRPVCQIEVDPGAPPSIVPAANGAARDATGGVHLNWEKTLDDQGHLRQCPVCSCRELFVRKDFPQRTGIVLVVLAAVAATVLFALNLLLWSLAVLGAMAMIDLVIYCFTGRCLVCYRCRSEFRGLPISKGHPGWDLATGEKYRAASPGESARA